MSKLSITSQIAELKYTIDAMRKWHAHEVNARHIRREVADWHEQHQLAILDTLRWFEREEDFIRAAFKQRREAKDAENGEGVDRGDAGSATT